MSADPTLETKESDVADRASGPALEVRNLWAGYNGKPVLEGVSFQVDRGVRGGIIGPKGWGKWTRTKTVRGLVKQRRGEV